MKLCEECYSDDNRFTPLLNKVECLTNHTQYICGTCGRCICINYDEKRKLQRWNFPFKSLEVAKLYLRTADYTMKKSCGIYKIEDKNTRISFKIFSDIDSLNSYLSKNKDKSCITMKPEFSVKYKEYPNTQIRRLNDDEIKIYLSKVRNI